MQRTRFASMVCSIARTLDVVGDQWSPLILRDVFVGIAQTADAATYLRGVGYRQLSDVGSPWTGTNGSSGSVRAIDHAGGAPTMPPGQAGIWVASTSGPGTQQLDWRPADGDWTLVVMRADAGPGVAVRAQVGATVPSLPWFATVLLVTGVVLLAIGSLLVALAVHRAQPPSPEGAVPGMPGGPGGPATPAPAPPVTVDQGR